MGGQFTLEINDKKGSVESSLVDGNPGILNNVNATCSKYVLIENKILIHPIYMFILVRMNDSNQLFSLSFLPR
jgi:hypothetical protein